MEALRKMTYDFHPEAEEEFLSAINIKITEPVI
jgi:hypothetical protein